MVDKKKYKGFVYYQTNPTTDVYRCAFGQYYKTTAHVYRIEGLKPEGRLPFLTSEVDVKAYINSELDE